MRDDDALELRIHRGQPDLLLVLVLKALAGFQRFPTWMWRNTVVREFVEWLREHNRALPPSRQVGFYGMDLYSLFKSIAAVLAYLDRVDPEARRVVQLVALEGERPLVAERHDEQTVVARPQ